MAEQLALVQRDDFTVDIDQVSLLDYTDGFQSAYRGWKMQAEPEQDSGRVIEVIKLRAKGSSIDNLASKLQGLADKVWQSERYAPIDRYGVWLRAQLAGETNARQAFVYAIRQEQASSVFDQAMLAKFQLNEYNLAIERSPYWEGTASTNIISGTTLSTMGGTHHYTAMPGDVPARMAMVQIANGTAAVGSWDGVGNGGMFWVGFRSDRYGNHANFNPYWDWGKCAILGAGGTLIPDGDSRMGTIARWGTTSFPVGGANILMGALSMYELTSNYSDQRGHFLGVLRAAPGIGSTFSLYLRYGPTPNRNSCTPKVLMWETGGLYNLYPMGVIDIGNEAPYSVNGSTVNLYGWGINLWGQRIAGTGFLKVDTLFLIPLEGIAIMGQSDRYNRNAQTTYQALQRANENIEYTGFNEAYPDPTANYIEGNCQMEGGIPPGEGLAVVLGETDANSNVGEPCQLTVKAMPRWKELRGAD